MLLSEIASLRNGKFLQTDARFGQYPIYGSTGIIGRTNNILIEQDAVVIGRVGANCGSVQYAFGPSWITDNCIICTNKNSDLRYLFYLLSSKELNKLHTGSAQPLLTSKVINSLEVPSFSESEQRHIVDIRRNVA